MAVTKPANVNVAASVKQATLGETNAVDNAKRAHCCSNERNRTLLANTGIPNSKVQIESTMTHMNRAGRIEVFDSTAASFESMLRSRNNGFVSST
jgi:hypothetical protein